MNRDDYDEWILAMHTSPGPVESPSNTSNKIVIQTPLGERNFGHRSRSAARPRYEEGATTGSTQSKQQQKRSKSVERKRGTKNGKRDDQKKGQKEEFSPVQSQRNEAKAEFQREVDKYAEAVREYRQILARLPQRNVLLRSTAVSVFENDAECRSSSAEAVRQHGSLVPLQDFQTDGKGGNRMPSFGFRKAMINGGLLVQFSNVESSDADRALEARQAFSKVMMGLRKVKKASRKRQSAGLSTNPLALSEGESSATKDAVEPRLQPVMYYSVANSQSPLIHAIMQTNGFRLALSPEYVSNNNAAGQEIVSRFYKQALKQTNASRPPPPPSRASSAYGQDLKLAEVPIPKKSKGSSKGQKRRSAKSPKPFSVKVPVCLETLGITQAKPWHLQWMSSYMKTHDYKGMTRFQKINQFPWSIELTRKDSLAHNLDRMAQLYGTRNFSFLPDSYVLPSDASAFNEACENCPESIWIVKPSGAAQGRGIYLTQCLNGYAGGGLPPPPLTSFVNVHSGISGSPVPGLKDTVTEQGNEALFSPSSFKDVANPIARMAAAKASGVDVDSPMFTAQVASPSSRSQRGRSASSPSPPSSPTDHSFPSTDTCIVSRYINNPLLIDGFKFDIRIYVAVTSFDPLVAYIHRQGLTRFATREYDDSVESLNDKFVHLTNYSINKRNLDYVIGTAEESGSSDTSHQGDIHGDGHGHKWTIQALLKRLAAEGFDVDALWSKLEDLVSKTLLSSQERIVQATRRHVPFPHDNCFQLFGFDVMIDDRLKPWLLEVNLSPSLKTDSPLDLQVKSQVISDLLSLVGFGIPPAVAFTSKQNVVDISPESVDISFSAEDRHDSHSSVKSVPASAKATRRKAQQASLRRPVHSSAAASRKSKEMTASAPILPPLSKSEDDSHDYSPASPRWNPLSPKECQATTLRQKMLGKLQRLSMECHKKWLCTFYEFLIGNVDQADDQASHDLVTHGIGIWITLPSNYPSGFCQFIDMYDSIIPEELKEIKVLTEVDNHLGKSRQMSESSCVNHPREEEKPLKDLFPPPVDKLINGYASNGKTVFPEDAPYMDYSVDTHLIPLSIRRFILDCLNMPERLRSMVTKFEQEHARRGQFQRIMPTVYRNSFSWRDYFETARTSKDATEDALPTYLLRCFEVNDLYTHVRKEIVRRRKKRKNEFPSSGQLCWRQVMAKIQPFTFDRMLTVSRSGSGTVRKALLQYEKREREAWEFLKHDQSKRYYAGKKPKHLPDHLSRKPKQYRTPPENRMRSFQADALSAMFAPSNVHMVGTWQSHLKITTKEATRNVDSMVI